MKPVDLVKRYLEGLSRGSYEEVVKLFSEDAVVESPLYGAVDAREFYRMLFSDTARSEIELVDVFTSVTRGNAVAAYFRYAWTLKSGEKVAFDCVDIFELDEEGRVKRLKIVYDTWQAREAFRKLREG